MKIVLCTSRFTSPALYIGGVRYGGGLPCPAFVAWMTERFPNGEADGKKLWNALDVPGWMAWFLSCSRIFGPEGDELGRQLADLFDYASTPDPKACAAIRLACPAELLEALFVEEQERRARIFGTTEKGSAAPLHFLKGAI